MLERMMKPTDSAAESMLLLFPMKKKQKSRQDDSNKNPLLLHVLTCCTASADQTRKAPCTYNSWRLLKKKFLSNFAFTGTAELTV